MVDEPELPGDAHEVGSGLEPELLLVYLGIGATVGALVRSEINGSLVVVFAWMFDVFFGPAMGGTAGLIRVFPLHFPTLVVIDVASGHAGPLGDLGISALWAAGALLTGTVALVENGQRGLQILSMTNLHGAIMVPITVGFLAGLAGLFVALGSAGGDRRLVLAGYRPIEVLAARLGVIVFAALLTTGVALAVTSASFTPQSWLTFAAANILVALTYGMIGVLAGPRLGLLGGLYVMLALPFIDIGIAQNAMFDAAPQSWAAFMPANGAIRVLLDGAFTRTFD